MNIIELTLGRREAEKNRFGIGVIKNCVDEYSERLFMYPLITIDPKESDGVNDVTTVYHFFPLIGGRPMEQFKIHVDNIERIDHKNLFDAEQTRNVPEFKNHGTDIVKYVSDKGILSFLICETGNFVNSLENLFKLLGKFRYQVFKGSRGELRFEDPTRVGMFISFIDIKFIHHIYDTRNVSGMGVTLNFFDKKVLENAGKLKPFFILNHIVSHFKENLIRLDGQTINKKSNIPNEIRTESLIFSNKLKSLNNKNQT